MIVSYNWLQEYLEKPLPQPDELARVLTMHAFEVEDVAVQDDDYLLDIDVLPNRTHDCLSHIGIAREIAVLTDNTLKIPRSQVEADSNISTREAVTLSVEDVKLVPRAMKRLVVDVEVGKSPTWLREKLVALGHKPINNIVDATNFVMLETGQPVHAFDFDKVAGAVSIRAAHDGETITTLDGEDHTLDDSMLVIADEKKALDIAGVKGGANSGITESTTKVLLSVCNFNQANIRQTSRKLGLITDASKRFEQGITPELAERAMNRLAELVEELADGKVAADTLDIYPRVRKPYKVGVTAGAVNKLLGTDLGSAEIEKILNRLDFSYEKALPKERALKLAPELEGTPYKYGASISYDAPETFDCSSFIAYLFAQGGLPVPRMAVDQYVFGEEVSKKDLKPGDIIFSSKVENNKKEERKASAEFIPGHKLDKSIDHCGLYVGGGKVVHASGKWDKGGVVIEDLDTASAFKNIVGYGRFKGADKERFVVTVPDERLDLMAERSFLASGTPADVIEEIGRVHGYEDIEPKKLEGDVEQEINKRFYYVNKIRDILVNEGFSEVYTYTFQNEGEVELKNPMASDKNFLRSSLVPGLKDALAFNVKYKELLGVQEVCIFELGNVFPEKEREVLELGIACENEKDIKDAFEKFDLTLSPTIKDGVGIATIDIKKLPEPTSYDDLEDVSGKSVTYQPISQYPFVLRDISLWVPAGTEMPVVWEVIWEAARPSGLVGDRIVIFDNYIKKDESGNEKKRSYAFRLVFQSYEKTLSDKEVNEVMKEIEKAIEKKGWEVR